MDKKTVVITSIVINALLLLSLCLCSCTYNVSMAHTSGTATDVIDDTASNTPNVSPKITIPMTPGSSVEVTK